MESSLNGLNNDLRSLNGLESDNQTLGKITASLPLEYDTNFNIAIKGLSTLGSANQILKMNSGATALEFTDDSNTEYTATLPLSISPSNVISTAFTADSTTTMSNKTISDELHGNNNTETYIDFNNQYGFPIYAKYLSASLRSYNMSFQNTQTSSKYPFIAVSNAGDMILHINGVGDAMTIKIDRDININVGDLIGDTTSLYSKKRMKDIYCRNIYAEPIEIKNSNTSSGYVKLYENSDNGTNYIKLEAPASLGSDITATLPSTTGVLALQSEIPTNNLTLTNGALYITPSSSDNLSNKTFTDLTNFNASISVKGSSNFGTGSVRFYDLDNSHYTEVRSPNTMLQNAGITLPNITCVLSYEGQNISVFTNNAGYITSSAISSFITATSTDTLENKTLKSPIFTSQSGAYEKMILKDENLTHNINIFTPNLTDNINVAFPSATGTLAITDDIPTNNNELTNGSGYITADSTNTLTNKSIAYTQLTGTPTIPTNNNQLTNGAGYITSATNYWELSSSTLAPKLDTYNVIIGQKSNANANNVELLVYGDAEIKQKLYSSSDSEIYLDFDDSNGVKVYGKYNATTTTSYNMSFHNTQTGNTHPFISVDNTGNFIVHINGVADILRVKTDKNVEIVNGDLIGTATGNFPKKRMNDIYSRNIYTEPIYISNGSTSSGFLYMYEDSDNGTNYTKLQATASIGSNNTLTLPTETGTLISSATNNLCVDATSTISIASSSNPQHLDIYTPEIEVSTLGDTNAFLELRSGTGNASSSNVSQLKFYNKNNTKSAFLGLDSGDEAYFVNNASNNSGETKLSLISYTTFADAYYTSTRAYPLSYRSSINSTYYAHFYTTSSSSNGFHISSVGDSWETLVGRDIKYYDTDFTGETNGVASYAKLQMGDIFMEDLYAEALNYTSATQVSDARLKINLKPIENAIDTLNKLTPLTYDKKVKEEDDLWGKEYQKESGLIAQDVYNEVPELKFIVNNVAEDIPENFDSSGNLVRDCCGWDIIEDQPRREYPIEVDASGNPTENSGKVIQEATYKKVKNPNKKLSINYEDLIAYLIKGVQDLSKQVNQQQVIIDKLLSSSSFKQFKS